MRRRTRRLLLIAAFVLFFAIAPAVVLYAVGYRFTVFEETGRTPVGVVLVETIPTDATIEVDGKRRGQSPQAISELSPGRVQVSVTKEGYEPWEKHVRVRPARATELRNIRLFPRSPDTSALAAGVARFQLAPNRTLIAVVDTLNQLRVISTEGEVVMESIQLPVSLKSLQFAPDSTRILLTYTDGSRAVVDIQQTDTNVSPIPRLSSAVRVQWDPGVPGRLFAITNQDALVSYNIVEDRLRDIAEDVAAFAPLDGRLLVARTDGTLHRVSVSGSVQQTYKTEKDAAVQAIYTASSGQAALHFADGSIHYLDGSELRRIAGDVRTARWGPAGNMLMLHTEHNELFVYNAGDERIVSLPMDEKRLVLRLSRPIRYPQWFPTGHHIIFQIDDELLITEIDTRDHPIQYSVDTTNVGNAQAAAGEAGEAIYYVSRQSDTPRLLRAELLKPADR